MSLTECCGVEFIDDTDLCSDCLEHANEEEEADESCCVESSYGFRCTCIRSKSMSEEEADARYDDYLESKYEDERIGRD